MSSYTVEELCRKGSPYALAMVLRALGSGEPFVRYKDIKAELEQRLGFQSIFTVQIGAVAGAMMNDILSVDPKAPLINVLICGGDRIPGRGAGSYLARRYGDPALNDWALVPLQRKREIVEQERQKVLAYTNWRALAEDLYGNLPELSRVVLEQTQDYEPKHGGPPESDEHKRLKEWVLSNPERIGIAASPDYAAPEEVLLSGDEVDVMFRCGETFYVVEVKSCRSNDADFRRGIYQCIKYRAVKLAEQAPSHPRVVAILVTESQMPKDLVDRAKLLQVEWRKVTPS
jgi:hypothetical protein